MERRKQSLWGRKAGLRLGVTGAFCLVPLLAAAVGYDSLLENSPFQPPPARRVEPEPKPPARENNISRLLEFRGMVELSDGNWEFSIHNRKDRTSRWFGLDEGYEKFPYRVVGFDPAARSITVAWGSERQSLDMMKFGESGRGGVQEHFTNVAISGLSLPSSPPRLAPPPNPPPPPISAPPPGPPPQIPPGVMERFERMVAAEESSGRSGTGRGSPGFTGGMPGGSPPPPPSGISGLPAARRPHPDGPGSAVPSVGGGSGGTAAPIQIPGSPGFSPGAPPPTPPPNIVIPDIPDFPAPGGDGGG